MTSETSDSLRKNACSYWKNQDKLVDNMQTFANGWFERRHAGAHAALEAAQRMFKAETSVDLVREYQDWASGAFQRVVVDRAPSRTAATIDAKLSSASTSSDAPLAASLPLRPSLFLHGPVSAPAHR